MKTVRLTFDARQKLPDGAALPERGRETSQSYVFEIPCPYDPDRLTERARRMMAAAATTFSADDLSTIFGVYRRVAAIETAADAFAKETPEHADRIRRRAGDWRHAYEKGDAREEWVEVNPGAAPPDAALDATDYLNRLAQTPGLAIRSDLASRPVRIDENSVDVGVEPWRFMLTGREYRANR